MTEQQQALRNRGICVIIPTFNNGGTIAGVVSRALEQCCDVYVVCDGCTDDTLSILEGLPQKPVIVSYECNKGKGAALKAGFKAALSDGFAYAITLDADGQHYPEDIPSFLQANMDHPGNIIVGSRKGLENVRRSKGSSFANSFSNFWFFLQTGHRLKDTQTGYRLYPLKRMKGMSLITSRYEAELELLVLSSWRGVGIDEVDVNVYYPSPEERVSHFRPVKDFARIFILNTVLCILALVYGYPRTILRFAVRVLRSVLTVTVFVVGMFFFVTPGVFLYLTIGGKTEEKKDKVHKFICSISRYSFLKIGIPGVKYSQTNISGEDFSKPAVIICNHQSHLDLLPMLALAPKTVMLTANWVWRSPFYGYIIRNVDYLPASDGMESILPRVRDLVDRGYSVVVYPEGTRSLDTKIGRFHQGAFFLARELNLDIVPLVLYGTGKALPKHGRLLRKWPAHMEIDRRITQGELSSMGETLKEQASKMRKYYNRRYREIADVIERDLK